MHSHRIVRGAVSALLVASALQGLSPAAAKPPAPVVAAIQADEAAAVKRLQQWIALPTIANMGVNHAEGAAHMRQLALDAGFQQGEVIKTAGVPAVFATLDAGAPTTLGVYFMYDVKHYDPKEWNSPPLEARLVDRPGEGKAIVGRGAVNQKGPETAFLAAVKAFKDSGTKLPVNLVLVAEGEEEIGSPNFPQALASPAVQAALGKAAGVFIPGASQSSTGSVSTELGAKGVIEVQLISSGEKWGRGPNKDVHSSLMASVDNPAWRLVKALNTLVEDDGFTPAIDGYFENVRPLTAREKQIIAEEVAAGDEADIKKSLGIRTWAKDENFLTSSIRLAQRPTVNIQGLVSGYTGPGGKTVLPGRAEAKMDLRLVPNMTYDEAVTKLKAHLAKRGFSDIEVVVSGGYSPTEVAEDSVMIRAAQATLNGAGIENTLSARAAGSWPGVMFTGAPLKLPALGFGAGRGGGAHAPNEWFLVDSTNPKVAGMAEQSEIYADFLYEVAKAAAK
ncbi:M20/M25/M40 family metallo-hydrolase [Sphingomonas sabuli]|uniref:M20/M25/M40 family metallo-hydrolase n=1 Tax=Sphingomonas sabuli TaxID=2764186 RepID=A0A7G9L0Z4_9SPHN|nr:M20/M25/M40 family metallo-hydrolase [Sphingomonas sabuli]QNM82293.1 M20/M25/M40 family metallo-hydrolase [Sphingomonas sabuli]